MKTGIFQPLKNKSYRSLFGAQIFSDLGNWLDFVTLQVIVAYHWQLGETAIAAVIIVMALPWVVIGPFASVFVDRLPKKAIMTGCLITRIFFVAGLYFAPNLYVLLLFVFLKGTVAAIYDPARQSSIRMTVPEEDLAQAVTLSQLSVNTMKIAGPALGGALIALFGVRSPFIFEAAGFFIAVLFLLGLPALKTENLVANGTKDKKQEAGYWQELREGLRHISSAKLLRVSIVISAIAFFIIFLYDGLFVFIAQDLGFSKGNFGILISAVGLGSVTGSLLLGKWTSWKEKPVQLMAGSSVFSGFLIISIGLGGIGIADFPNIIWIAGAFLLGSLGSGESIPYGFLLQSETPKQMMGRVSAAATSIQTFSMLVAPAAGAFIAELIGVPAVLIGAGSATCLLGIIVLSLVAKKLSTAGAVKEAGPEAS
ncbi:MFS transporter [Bacillus sp. T33-2]|nr:MFS transporter [Bacillus sp. T33-2]